MLYSQLTDEWLRKIRYIHTVEYDSAVKKKEIIKHTGKCVELEKFRISEVIQVQKDTQVMFSLTVAQPLGKVLLTLF